MMEQHSLHTDNKETFLSLMFSVIIIYLFLFYFFMLCCIILISIFYYLQMWCKCAFKYIVHATFQMKALYLLKC